MDKIELIGLSKEELAAEIIKIGEKPFRAKQLWQWIYLKGNFLFERNTKKFFFNSILHRIKSKKPIVFNDSYLK